VVIEDRLPYIDQRVVIGTASEDAHPFTRLAGVVAWRLLVKTAYNVATLPVKAGGKVIDWTTTSQKEADRNAGRRMRLEEERQKHEQRALEKRCRKTPDATSCQPPSVYRVGRPN
jgi:hypothetical protein